MGSNTVWGPRSSDHFDPRFTVPTVKHSQLVIVRECFLGEEGEVCTFSKRTKNECRSLFASLGRPHAQLLQRSEVFMHDSTPCHKARKVTRYLKRKRMNIYEWPGNIPDLNPIENCWHKMKKLCQ